MFFCIVSQLTESKPGCTEITVHQRHLPPDASFLSPSTLIGFAPSAGSFSPLLGADTVMTSDGLSGPKTKSATLLLIEFNGQEPSLRLNRGKAVYLKDYPGRFGARRSEGIHH